MEDGMDQAKAEKVGHGAGFIAALDQSGGSTPRALAMYGIAEDAYDGEEQMYDQVHAMRARLMTSPSFGGDRVLGAILFEGTLDRTVAGRPTAEYLWEERGIVPFVKVDQGLADEEGGMQMMKPMPGLDALLAKARANGVFGTKMRSVIKVADPDGVRRVVDQQFEVAERIRAAGLVPIIEPEVDIRSPQKREAEDLLLAELTRHLDALGDGPPVMLKLSLPTVDDLYAPLVAHPRVLRVVALSGGYARDEANALLARNHGVIASFSRALLDGLTAQQTPEEFDAMLDGTIAGIAAASAT
jgi:fructose-bisphosphate aldolase class I